MDRPKHRCALTLTTLLPINAGIAHAQQRDIDSYYWINDFVLADINDDGLLDIAATNHGLRPRTLLNQGAFRFELPNPESPFAYRHILPELLPSIDTPTLTAPGLHVFYEGYWAKIVARGFDDYFGKLIITGDADDPYGNFAVINPKGNIINTQRTQISGRKQITLELAGDFELTLAPTNARRTLFANILIPHHIDKAHIHAGPRALPSRTSEINLTGFSDTDWHNTTWFDFNDDAKVDLFVAQGGDNGQATTDARIFNDHLFLSGPEPLMFDAAYESGIEKLGMPARGAMLADIDRNGLIDIYVRNDRHAGANKVIRNTLHLQGEHLRFEERAEPLGLDIRTKGLGKWFDPNNDGYPDLLWADDSTLRIFHNNKGTFTPETLIEGLTYSTWITIGDIDNDGDIDAVLACYPSPYVLINNNGTLEPTPATSLGINTKMSGAQLLDYNNDGRLDLYAPPSGIYLQNEKGRFKPTKTHATEPGWDPFAWGDLDHDGRLDLIRRTGVTSEAETVHDHTCVTGEHAQVKQAPVYTLTLFPNESDTNNLWYAINLVGPINNRQAIGATVLLEHHNTSQLAMVGQLESSQSSIGNYTLHFGLGSTPPSPDRTRLIVNWPDGTTTTLNAPTPNTTLQIAHPDRR